jgi:hypothetical protein
MRRWHAALRLWRCSGQPCNNQQRYGQMDITVAFKGSEMSRDNLGRSSNYSGRMFTTDIATKPLDKNTDCKP